MDTSMYISSNEVVELEKGIKSVIPQLASLF